MTQEFAALGKDVRDLMRKLDVFKTPEGTKEVSYTTDEVTALCPVTGQPDWYTVTIRIMPAGWCIESKSLKLFLQSFREEGHFCEQFAAMIAREIMDQVKPNAVCVEVVQKPRGGISIHSRANLYADLP